MKKSFLTKNILLLSIVSFLTDISSEMLYPIMPLYLSQIGYGAAAIGIIEGIADVVAGVSKGYFGYLADKFNNRVIFIRLGYGLSALSKPLIGFTRSIGFIFTGRLADRFGKGIRTAPRDAILAAESQENQRGRVFGFHRSLDTLGATVGPVIALIFLFFFPAHYQQLFFYVIIPGLLAVFFTFLVKDRPVPVKKERKPLSPNLYRSFWKTASLPYRKLVIGFFILAAVNSSDMFLLLRARELGFSDNFVIGVYIFYNLIFTLAAYYIGVLADKWGFRKVYIIGLMCFGVVYALFSRDLTTPLLFGAFAIYGIAAAANESISKAWLSKHIEKEHMATGIGLHLSLNSLAFLLASSLTGVIWQTLGSSIAFVLISVVSAGVIIYFSLLKVD